MNKERKGSLEHRNLEHRNISQQSWAQSIMAPPRTATGTGTATVVGDDSSTPKTILKNTTRYTMLSSPDHIPTPRYSQNDSENVPTPRHRGVENTYQENRGKRWSSEEDMYLLQQVSYLSHSDIGRHLRRSENAVISRLKKLAFHMLQNGEDPVVVQNNLHLKDEDIQQISNEFFIYPKKTNNKFIITTKKPIKKGYFAAQQSPEVQLLLEIRTMLRKLLHQSNDHQQEGRSLKRETLTNGARQAAIRISDLNIEDLERRSEEFANLKS
jgi:hypothetical protein